MAELASAYPTAGGLYFWAFRLGGRTWAWTTAWLNMIGQITITAGINVAAAIYIVGAVTRIFGLPADQAVPVFGTMTSWYFYVFVMVLIMIPQVVINIFGIRLTARLNDFSVYWHIGGVAIIALLLTLFGTHHNSLEFLFSRATVVNPLDASSADLGSGTPQPALVFGDFKFASPLFALFPGLTELYRAAPYATRASCWRSCRRSGPTPATTPRPTWRKRRSWRGRTPPGASSCRWPCRRSSAT